MSISDYQVSSVIKTYMKNMKVKARDAEKEPVKDNVIREDNVLISDAGMKKMLFERIGAQMTERLKGYE
jgi:hypothetical protein